MKEDMISFGEQGPYTWKHIIIDYPVATPILLNGIQVGAFFAKGLTFHENLKVIEMHGIEIYEEYRRRGVAKMVVQMLIEQCDMLIGSITEDQPKPFWLHMGAHFRLIPLDAFGKTIDTVHTKEPMFFFITENARAKLYGEKYAVEVPKLMREFAKIHG